MTSVKHPQWQFCQRYSYCWTCSACIPRQFCILGVELLSNLNMKLCACYHCFCILQVIKNWWQEKAWTQCYPNPVNYELISSQQTNVCRLFVVYSSFNIAPLICKSCLGVVTQNNIPGHAGTTNNVLGVAVVDISSPVDTELQCTFLSGFTGSAHCTVQYGTDPTYMNLPYSAEPNDTEAAGDSVSVVLRERLNSLTVYYYTVSAVSGDITVKVQGNFTTPHYCKL